MAVFDRVVVVGAGTMGSQIALQTAYSAHHEVALVGFVVSSAARPAGVSMNTESREGLGGDSKSRS
jgi:3-hydroxyacyl-CoA dehydrogenase